MDEQLSDAGMNSWIQKKPGRVEGEYRRLLGFRKELKAADQMSLRLAAEEKGSERFRTK